MAPPDASFGPRLEQTGSAERERLGRGILIANRRRQENVDARDVASLPSCWGSSPRRRPSVPFTNSGRRAAATEKRIDAEADRLLRSMTEYLAGLSSFRVTSASVDEIVTKDGRKLEFTADSTLSVARPNRLGRRKR